MFKFEHVCKIYKDTGQSNIKTNKKKYKGNWLSFMLCLWMAYDKTYNIAF